MYVLSLFENPETLKCSQDLQIRQHFTRACLKKKTRETRIDLPQVLEVLVVPLHPRNQALPTTHTMLQDQLLLFTKLIHVVE